MIIIENTDNTYEFSPKTVYRNIYKIIKDLEIYNPSVSNVHSIDAALTETGLLNVMFDYDNDYLVRIDIQRSGYIIIYTHENIADIVEGWIVNSYPEYENDIVVEISED